jgi:small GTP-binding protein
MSDTFSKSLGRMLSIEDRCSSTSRELNDLEHWPLVPLLTRGYVKMVLVGDTRRCHTELLSGYRPIHQIRFIFGHPLYLDVADIVCSIGSSAVRIRLWAPHVDDTFPGLFPVYLKNASVIFLASDTGSRSTSESLPKWLATIRSVCLNDPVVAVIGTEGAKFARRNGLNCYGDGFENALRAVLTEIDAREPEAFPALAAVENLSSAISDERNELNADLRARLSTIPHPTPRVEPPKIVMLGEAHSGKRSLIVRWEGSPFDGHCYQTILDFRNIARVIDGNEVKVRVWNTPGQEKFHSIACAYLRDAAGIFLVFDVTDRRSLDCFSRWLGAIKELCPDDTVVMVIGCKIDEKRVVTSGGADFARDHSFLYFETSAQTNKGVEAPIIAMIREVRAIDERRWISERTNSP